ncbi:hypothetical protein EJ08DRAFT_700254 [Tothia fuscella]|uniref:Uncharacterized protein n=1 Tax=Tothia fuscella TaxID=1048955 RepID=A0A9P4NKV5_9PEZI|nr:hypothetical protein EJ08DRAFT_700254 [Tothia fuscella]
MWARRNSMPMSQPYQGHAAKDAGRRIAGRDAPSEPAAGIVPSKAMVTATTYMTMMVYETQRPVVTAGLVGIDPNVAAPVNAVPQPTSTADLHAKGVNYTSSPLSSQRKPGNYRLSESTEHVLIAAGAIGATIILTFVVYLIYRLRQGTSLREIFKSLKGNPSPHFSKKPHGAGKVEKVAAPAPRGSDWAPYNPTDKSVWEAETSFAGSSVAINQPYPPNPAFLRPGTSSSSRSLLTGTGLQAPSVAPFPPPNRRSLSAPPSMPLSMHPPTHGSNLLSPTPSSLVLPLEQAGNISHSRTDTKTSTDGSIPAYLANIVNGLPTCPPKISRFSWTNSQAPKTPMDPRFSMASSTNSVPRYRTVESWVGQQASRVEDQKAQEDIRRQIEEAIKEVNEASGITPVGQIMSPPMPPRDIGRKGSTPSVPDLPAQYLSSAVQPVAIASSSLPPHQDATNKNGAAVEAETSKRHYTQASDDPIFKAHPGTQVCLPRGSLIPSVILDGKVCPNEF